MDKTKFFNDSLNFLGQDNILRAAWFTKAILHQEEMDTDAWFKLSKYIMASGVSQNKVGIKDVNKLLLWYVLRNKRQNKL